MVFSALLAQAGGWQTPKLDYHALLPEVMLAVAIVVVLLADLFLEEHRKYLTSTIAGFGLLASFVPIVTFALYRDSASMFGGAYVVDDFSLVLKALFLLAGYVVVLMSSNYLDEGDFYQGEYYVLLLTSVLGMMMMSSSRDLVSIFVALEFLSIPAYMLAAWRKRDLKSNEAGMKYFLLGVFASAVMLYGMSLLYGESGTTLLVGINEALGQNAHKGVVALAVVFVIVGFAFKVSAVPFHTWAPDTYEGAPTPITAFLSVASKAAGFVALMELLFIGFGTRFDVWQPLFWVLAALTMTLGNVVALRQTNIVRMLAYSSVSQGGFILMPLAVAGYNSQTRHEAVTAIVTYLIAYAAMSLGSFAVVIAVARKTRSGEISSYGGLFAYAPGLTVAMTVFMASLAGIPPAGGWIAKFNVFKAVWSYGGGWGAALTIIGAVNSVIAFGYYGRIMREMWMKPEPNGDHTPVRVPQSIGAAIVITTVATMLVGVLPQVILRYGNLSAAFGG